MKQIAPPAGSTKAPNRHFSYDASFNDQQQPITVQHISSSQSLLSRSAAANHCTADQQQQPITAQHISHFTFDPQITETQQSHEKRNCVSCFSSVASCASSAINRPLPGPWSLSGVLNIQPQSVTLLKQPALLRVACYFLPLTTEAHSWSPWFEFENSDE